MKTLIGKQWYLFLINDSCNELDIHCNNLCNVKDATLPIYTFKNFLIFVYPDKSWYCREFLPDHYISKYRPSFDIYKNRFKEKCIDLMDCLMEDSFYKTDTHINIKGACFVYKHFIKTVNNLLHWNLPLKQIKIEEKYGENYHGDLLWFKNLNDQVIEDKSDKIYYSSSCLFWEHYKIDDSKNIRFLNYSLEDITLSLQNELVVWKILSDSIIYIYNKGPRVLIFYDSFLINSLPLYFDLFEVYFAKTTYDTILIDKIKPDYIFEFRVERFLF